LLELSGDDGQRGEHGVAGGVGDDAREVVGAVLVGAIAEEAVDDLLDDAGATP
jgi:hypothetical protein